MPAVVAFAVACSPPKVQPIALVPVPVSVRAQEGNFEVTSATRILVDSASREIGEMLAAYLRPATGFALAVVRDASGAGISLRIDPSSGASLGSEGYRLRVSSRSIELSASAPAGLFYGVQTLRQLLPPAVFGQEMARGVRWSVPAVTIEDRPRFAWRGMHLDVGRHFMPVEFVKRYIDLLALHKMNTFHWHLTEDQGWRIEIRKYPRLTEVGAWRSGTIIGRPNRDSTQNRYDSIRHGGFYTQDQVRDVVAYAAARFITIVPEIEMPGHAQAAIAAYPYLGVTGDTLEVWKGWGVSENILNVEESTIRFMQDVLTEVLELFPGPYIHVGGDEAVKTQWERSARVKERMRELGVADAHALQSWFIHRMDEFLTARGRRLVGWDEILEGGLAPGAVVMSWRGTKGGIEAARAGHDVVMAPTTHTYFDYYQSRDRDSEPLAIGGYVPLDTVYAFEPVPQELTAAEARHVLGAQAQLWTEYMKTPRHVEYMAYPRGSALSEVVWSQREARNFDDFMQRLQTHLQRLEAMGVNYRKPK
jgi:hexosaminidase